ncbi:class I SAM-dependent methyltransferase [Candidatus Manganitrophus noduliformans]|uniref:Class I SAM-dependent methyltransferase n=1 Tax=Candidatus Manganitrophus noduliformans TaxID=2606439 RepID=A0A7X6DQ62_9BACT|nr:class I SAM-dependent methyltransferase [Candidatus Manganitrophus noduliformans]NKE71297.1 class I SAM-dependent methyltransferase [Candidatus Manganitrophus noduliformans]
MAEQLGLFSLLQQTEETHASCFKPAVLFEEELSESYPFLSYRLSPSRWVTHFDGSGDRAGRHIAAVNRLPAVRSRLIELLAKLREDAHPGLCDAWMAMATAQERLYLDYSGEGGLAVSPDLIRSQLTYIRDRQPSSSQRKALLSGLYALLGSEFPPAAASLAESLRSQARQFSFGEISAVRVDYFLEGLKTLEEEAAGKEIFEPAARRLNSDEGNGAYYSPEVFQHLLRLIPLSAIAGEEINVLEPNVGKGSLIRPMVHHPGFLIVANDLNPISAEIAEVTTMVDPEAIVFACREGRAIHPVRNCAVFKSHAFDLLTLLPDHLFDLLIANPPYTFDHPKSGFDRQLRAMGLSKGPQGFSLAAYTRQILPVKLREGGISILITSARSRNFKRTRHASGHVTHPMMILAITGQPFSENDAELVPVSMPAYVFDGEGIAEKRQIRAECFVSINVFLSSREANGKQTVFSECAIIRVHHEQLASFVDLCLSPSRWKSMERQLLGPSMRMLQSANLLRIFSRIKEALRNDLEAKRTSAKRRYDNEEADRHEKRIEEVNNQRFHQIGTFEELNEWLAGLSERWNIPVRKEIERTLRTNPLREIFAKKRKSASPASTVAADVKRVFRAVLSVSDRFFSRFYLLSAIYPALALREIAERHGPFDGVAFGGTHPTLKRTPYPFSMYLLKESEISELLETFPEEERKEVLAKMRERMRLLISHVAEFNAVGKTASEALNAAFGNSWRQDLVRGVLPQRRRIPPLLDSGNGLVEALARLLLNLVEQDAVKVREKNEALATFDLIERQEQYQRYLKDFNSGGLTEKRIGNLVRKTEELIAVMQKAQEILSGSRTAPGRKIRLQPVG